MTAQINGTDARHEPGQVGLLDVIHVRDVHMSSLLATDTHHRPILQHLTPDSASTHQK